MTKLKKSIIVMAIISVIVVLVTSAIGINFWRTNMVMGIDSNQTYLIGDTNFTNPVNYQVITNTYMTGLSMIALTTMLGLYIDTVLWAVYGVGLLIIKIIKKARS